MQKLSEEVKYALDPEERFDVVRYWDNLNAPSERFRVLQVWRYVYATWGGGYRLLLSTHGPQIRKDGTLSQKRTGGVSLHGPGTDKTTVEALAAMPPALFDKLRDIGFFEEPED